MEVSPHALYSARLVRPDLPVPAAPGLGLPRLLVGLTEPRFAEVGRRVWRLVAVAALAALAGESLVTATVRPFVLGTVAAIAGYAATAAAVLALLRRRQARFEPAWLEAQSRILRDRRFDVLRFTTSEPARTAHGHRAVRRVYDLTRPDEVERLLSVRAGAAAAGLTVPMTVEFSYPRENGLGVEEIRGELGSIQLVPGAGDGSARVRFPAARYGVTTSTGRRTTYWVLGLPLLTVPRWAPDRQPALARP